MGKWFYQTNACQEHMLLKQKQQQEIEKKDAQKELLCCSLTQGVTCNPLVLCCIP